MNERKRKIINQELLKIKRIVDKDKNNDRFIIIRTKKNVDFLRNYSLNYEDVKNIIRKLKIDDYIGGPERDENPKYDIGWIFKFAPMFEDVKLYIKIRIENDEKSICLSIHEFGEYN